MILTVHNFDVLWEMRRMSSVGLEAYHPPSSTPWAISLEWLRIEVHSTWSIRDDFNCDQGNFSHLLKKDTQRIDRTSEPQRFHSSLHRLAFFVAPSNSLCKGSSAFKGCLHLQLVLYRLCFLES